MCSSVSWEQCMTPWLMKPFQSFLHYLLKCMVVNRTLSVFVLIWGKLDSSGEKFCSASSVSLI